MLNFCDIPRTNLVLPALLQSNLHATPVLETFTVGLADLT